MDISSKTIDEIDRERQKAKPLATSSASSQSKENLQKLEAIFFVSGRFLSMTDLISLSDLNPIVIKDSIEQLKEKYEKIESAIEIIEKNEKWKMDIKKEYSYIINKLATGSAEFSKAEQETLAIIAFKQPIKQSVIIKIRGNKAYEHIKKFDDLKLIKKKKMGHTYNLTLSGEFYEYFNVSNKQDFLKEHNRGY